MTYDPGWRATVDGRAAQTRTDQLGFLVVEPGCSGACEIELKYEGSLERRICFAISCVVGLALLVALVIR